MAAKPIPHRVLQLVEYDPSSPSFLVWCASISTLLKRSKVKPGSIAGKLRKDGYYILRVRLTEYPVSRIVWTMFNGPIPPDHEIDHFNRIRTDNDISNLRCVPILLNKRNSTKQRRNNSGFTGVRFNSNPNNPCWVVQYAEPCTGKCVTKSFSIKKFGSDAAKAAAVEWRANALSNLVQNHGYTKDHGT
jgi:hypothetical protein